MARSGGELIVDVLQAQGVDRIFGVPGESFLNVLDALVDTATIDVVIAKHEGAASMMADADGKMTGRPGIAMVTRGPGASNAYSGVHVAFQDSTPMILFVGLIARDDEEREAFQEFDLKAIFGTQAKWVTTIRDAKRVPELVTRAFSVAMNGRPGPVVIGIPEDMQHDLVEHPVIPDRVEPVHGAPRGEDVDHLCTLLADAKRPMVIVGGETWDEQARSDLVTFARTWKLPVGVAFRCQDRLSPDEENYVGDVGLSVNPKLAQRVRDADLVVSIGARLGDCTTSGFTLIDIPVPAQKLVHVHPSAEEVGRIYAPEIGICSGVGPFLSAMAARQPAAEPVWAAWTKDARADYMAWSTPTPSHGPLNMAEVMSHLRENLPAQSVVCNGAGNYAIWLHRFFRYRSYRAQLAPTSGSMGYGLPAAIAAKLRNPDKPVVCLAGDGCLQMTIQELGTAQQYGAPVMVILCNNGMYGTIRMHQEKRFPGRVSATGIVNPDFVALAKAYGMEATRVKTNEEFETAFDRMLKMGTSCLLELVIDPEDLTPKQTLSEIRQAAIDAGQGTKG